MSREVKFRAWLKDLEIMQTVSELNMWNLGHVFTFDEDNFHCKTSGNVNYILMQYTGLKDKNGKDVYEGDIVKCTSGCPHEVIFLQEYAGMYFGGMPAWYLSGLKEGYAWTESEEIIGNVYENPELLEVQL